MIFTAVTASRHSAHIGGVNTTPSSTATVKPVSRTIAGMPELAAEWDNDANGELTPADVFRSSAEKIAWICPSGHRYRAAANNRAYSGTGCPQCYNESRRGPRTPKAGQSLAEAFPAIAADWDVQANHPLTPADVSAKSRHQALWTCPEGHASYTRKIFSRTAAGSGCPKCSKARAGKLTSKINSVPRPGRSLAEVFPDVAATWDYEANHPVTPADVAARSNKKAYFICPEGHGSTESYISNRTAGNGCPDCGKERSAAKVSSRAVSRGTLAAANPALVPEWNTELNTLTPSDVSPGTPKVVWWNCPAGHDPYEAQVARRHRGQGCPACGEERRRAALIANNKQGPKPGNSLADKRPDLVPEWDTERNALTPEKVSAGSHKVVHWICPDGHRYERSVVQRATVNTCPVERAERSEARKARGQHSAAGNLAA